MTYRSSFLRPGAHARHCEVDAVQVEWLATRENPVLEEGEAPPPEMLTWMSVSNLSAIKAVVVPSAVRCISKSS